MTLQSAVCLQVNVLPGKEKELETLLNTGGNPSLNASFFSLDKIKSVHFARWLIAPATPTLPASVIYAANVDGSVEQHFSDLNEKLAEDLDQIFRYCKGYPEQASKEQRLAFMKQHSIKSPAFYVGAPGRTVQRIHREAEFHDELEDFVKKEDNSWKTEKEAYQAIRKRFKDDKKWNLSKQDIQLPKGNRLKMIALILLVLLLLPIILLVVLGIHLFYELPAKPFGVRINEIPKEQLHGFKSKENIIYQNQLSQVFETKTGLRKIFLHFILWATNFGAKNWFVKGDLMGTPTIHFARWVFIDGGKRFVFFSNFDGSYDGYLGDFVDNNGWGLNAIYGAAVGYPRTLFVFGKGSYKLLEFMGWGRLTQVQTNIWYSAYPWYGLQQIIRRSELCNALLQDKELNDKEISETLKRI